MEKKDCNDFAGFECDKRHGLFARKDNLKRHYRNIHKEELEDDNVNRTECLYPGCKTKLYDKIKMLEHMEQVHHTNIKLENLKFNSFTDFTNGKKMKK